MALYSIADLERLSGVKSHTIRIWEKRYGLLQPERTDTNIRRYGDEQLRKLLNIVVLMENGLKVSGVAELSEKDINSRIISLAQDPEADVRFEASISQLMNAGLSFDEAAFREELDACVYRYGLKDCYVNVLYPLMVRVGLMWGGAAMRPGQEHFISNLIKQQLHVAIQSLPARSSSGNTWVLFLPEHEDHEIGLLLAHFMLSQAGHRVVYLGQRVPLESLAQAITGAGATHTLSFLVRREDPDRAAAIYNELRSCHKDTKHIVAGAAELLDGIDLDPSIRTVTSIGEFDQLL